jgi:hypothetical protein
MSFAVITTTVLTSAVFVDTPDIVSSGSNVLVESACESNRAEAFANNMGTRSGASGISVEALESNHWSAEKNARFKELARDEALRELSAEELAELESLTRLRRQEKYPRSPHEILWQRRQQKLTRSLVEALKAYVEFHETPHNSQTFSA